MKWQSIIARVEVYRFAMIVFQLVRLGIVNKNETPFLQWGKNRRGFGD